VHGFWVPVGCHDQRLLPRSWYFLANFLFKLAANSSLLCFLYLAISSTRVAFPAVYDRLDLGLRAVLSTHLDPVDELVELYVNCQLKEPRQNRLHSLRTSAGPCIERSSKPQPPARSLRCSSYLDRRCEILNTRAWEKEKCNRFLIPRRAVLQNGVQHSGVP
jgi:hypothetical protein